MTLCVVTLVSIAHTGSARLLCSGILGMRALSAPLSETANLRLQLFGLVGLFLEDVPQLVLQVRIILDEERFQSTAVIALMFTGLALVFGLGKRVWLWWSSDQDAKVNTDIVANSIGGKVAARDGKHGKGKTANWSNRDLDADGGDGFGENEEALELAPAPDCEFGLAAVSEEPMEDPRERRQSEKPRDKARGRSKSRSKAHSEHRRNKSSRG